MTERVCRPLIRIFGATEGGEEGQAPFHYNLAPSVGHYRETGNLPEMRANKTARIWAAKHRKSYTITLRESSHWPGRNSNLYDWTRFARTLDGDVVFIRDAEKAYEPLESFEICPEASLDLHKRLALYRAAEMNFFVSNGPATLATCTTDIPYIAFFKDDPAYPIQDKEWFVKFIGFERGEQYPWATERQRLVWQDDTFENISNAFRKLTETQQAA